MKTKSQPQKPRPLWTPKQVQTWLEDCPPPDSTDSYAVLGWVVAGSLYCAACVHALVETGHHLPSNSPAIPLGAASYVCGDDCGDDCCENCCEYCCEGCGNGIGIKFKR